MTSKEVRRKVKKLLQILPSDERRELIRKIIIIFNEVENANLDQTLQEEKED